MGSDLVTSIGQLILDFVVGLIENLIRPLIEGIFGSPSAE